MIEYESFRTPRWGERVEDYYGQYVVHLDEQVKKLFADITKKMTDLKGGTDLSILELHSFYIKVLINIYCTLEKANKTGKITDTIWFDEFTTLFDYIVHSMKEGGKYYR